MSTLELALIPLLGPAALPFVIVAGAVYAGASIYAASCQNKEIKKNQAAQHLSDALDNVIGGLAKEMTYISSEFRPDVMELYAKKEKLINEFTAGGGDIKNSSYITREFNILADEKRKEIISAKYNEERAKKNLSIVTEKIEKLIQTMKSNNVDIESGDVYFKTFQKLDGVLDKTEKMEKLYMRLKETEKNGIKNIEKEKNIEEVYLPKDVEKRYAAQKHLEELKELDKEEYEKNSIEIETISSERLEIVSDNLRSVLGTVREKYSWTKVYKETLLAMQQELATLGGEKELELSIGELCEKKYITSDEYLALKERSAKAVVNRRFEKERKETAVRFAEKTREKLRDMGYEVEDESNNGTNTDEIEKMKEGAPVYFNSGDHDYRVMARINEEGEFVTRVIRVVESEDAKEGISEYQQMKDAEHAGKWCRDYDKLLESLEKEGLKPDVRIRKEPAEEHVMYITKKRGKKSEVAAGENIIAK